MLTTWRPSQPADASPLPFPLDSTLTLGRSKLCSIVLDDARISAEHATLTRTAHGCFVTDRSTNGTYVNGSRVEKGAHTPLKEGDIISLVVSAKRPPEQLSESKRNASILILTLHSLDSSPPPPPPAAAAPSAAAGGGGAAAAAAEAAAAGEARGDAPRAAAKPRKAPRRPSPREAIPPSRQEEPTLSMMKRSRPGPSARPAARGGALTSTSMGSVLSFLRAKDAEQRGRE